MNDAAIIYRTHFEAINNLPEGEQLAAYKAIIAYCMDDQEAEGGVPAAILGMARPVLDKWKKNRRNGQQGGLANAERSESESEALEKQTESESEALAKQPESECEPKVKVKVKDKEKVSSIEDTKKKPAPKEKPMHFGDLGNVLLTETEHAKLIADKGQKAVDDAIAYLDAYIADKGYKHKSSTHYLAMRRWVFDAVNERKSPPGKIRPINKGYSERTYDMDAVEKELFAKMMAD